MLRNEHLLERNLNLPPDLSAEERQTLVEQARYETFAQPGVTARVTLVGALISVMMLLAVALVTLVIYITTDIASASPIAKALLTGVLLLIALQSANAMHQKYRAKLLGPAIDRLLQSRNSAHP